VNGRPLKLLIDVPTDPAGVAALRRDGRFEVDCIDPPAEEARAIDPARLRDVDVLFCTFPPSNFAGLQALRWVQISSTGYSQLFGLDLTARGSAPPTPAAASTCPLASGAPP
jgi:hypothetical protein